MMLLIYDSFGEIPEKRHLFYRKCFDVLTREHDSLKGEYTRELLTGLSIDELEGLFTAFCALSYAERDFSFTPERMKEYLNDAIAATALDVDWEQLATDLTEGISIMELVGDKYEFAHRSFQEYFYAKYVIYDRSLSLKDKITWLIEDFGYDDTVSMIIDMNRIYFEDDYLLPHSKKFLKSIQNIDPSTNPSAILSKFFSKADARLRQGENKTDMYTFSYTIKNEINCFVFEECSNMLRKSGLYPTMSSLEMSENEPKAKKHYEQSGGPVKIHHSNNKKLIELGSVHFAERIVKIISDAVARLEDRQAKRKASLGSKLRSSFKSRAKRQ